MTLIIYLQLWILAFGSQSDGGVFKESTFGRALESGTIKLPADSPLPNTNSVFSHYFVGDEAFSLKSYILRPYPGKNLDIQKRIFNYRLARTRRIIENAFGILSSRWRILRNNIIADVETAEEIIPATVCLHNFLRFLKKKFLHMKEYIVLYLLSTAFILMGVLHQACLEMVIQIILKE